MVGTQKGQLYVFKGTKLAKVVPTAHAGKVNAVFCLQEHNVLLSGGDDGVVRFWKADDLSPLHQIRINSAMSGDAAPINSITTDVKSKALVGTKCGEIWEISDEARLMVEAHGKGELWGVALHPSDENKMATCSDDGTLRLWNITPGKGRTVYARAWPRREDSKRIPNSSFNTGCVRSVAWHPDGRSLSVGTIAGKVHVYEYYEYKGEPRPDVHQGARPQARVDQRHQVLPVHAGRPERRPVLGRGEPRQRRRHLRHKKTQRRV